MLNSCNKCNQDFEESEILILNCGHRFNWRCIEKYLKINKNDEKNCPVPDCNQLISDAEIRKVLSIDDLVEYEREYFGIETNSAAEATRSTIANIDSSPLIPNVSIFQCETCCREIGKGQGIQLRNCFDNICRDCLCEHVKNSDNIPIGCPFLSCKAILDDRECREILPDEDKIFYERRCLDKAISRGNNTKTDYCRKPDCSYLVEISNNLKSWKCKKCGSLNCIACNVEHTNRSCAQYRATADANNNKQMIEAKIQNKELMRCPDCQQLIKKVSGCNWIACPSCKVELCWITQQHRWGRNGRGDTSGGCRCGVNGPCAPGCGGCIPDTSSASTYTPSYTPSVYHTLPREDTSSCAIM